jgi:uncharacterized protein YoxC
MAPLASVAIHSLRAILVPADTIWVRTANPPSGWFDGVTHVASGVLILTLLIVVIGLVPTAWRMRKAFRRLTSLIDKFHSDMAPLLKHANGIADNVNFISTAIREDVARISATLLAANSRLEDAVAMTERRMRDFNALLAVAQQEAEGLFLSTAATVRGVREGALRFAGGDGPELASVEAEDDGLEAVVDDEDIDYGNDNSTLDPIEDDDSDDDPNAPRAPRISRRIRR